MARQDGFDPDPGGPANVRQRFRGDMLASLAVDVDLGLAPGKPPGHVGKNAAERMTDARPRGGKIIKSGMESSRGRRRLANGRTDEGYVALKTKNEAIVESNIVSGLIAANETGDA